MRIGAALILKFHHVPLSWKESKGRPICLFADHWHVDGWTSDESSFSARLFM